MNEKIFIFITSRYKFKADITFYSKFLQKRETIIYFLLVNLNFNGKEKYLKNFL